MSKRYRPITQYDEQFEDKEIEHSEEARAPSSSVRGRINK